MMGTLTSSPASSKLFARKNLVPSLGFNDGDNSAQQIRSFIFKKSATSSCRKLFSLQRNPIFPVSSLPSSSSYSQVINETAETQLRDQHELPTVHVKLQLQKECRFGEQFFIVGNDPILGLWNPLGAIPMDWSDGHVWTTELDIPVGKSLQFKFILKKINGKILWQPGPDRILQMWQTKDTISILEDWNNAEVQQVTEEENVQNQFEESTDNSAILMVADNLSLPTNGAMTDVSKQTEHTYGSSLNEAEKPEVPSTKDPEAIHNINENVKPITLVADNITYMSTDVGTPASYTEESEKNPATVDRGAFSGEDIYGNEEIGVKAISHVEKGLASGPNNDEMMAEDMFESKLKDAEDQNLQSTLAEDNLTTIEEIPVLVPGLIPRPDMLTGEVTPKDKTVDASFIEAGNAVQELGDQDPDDKQKENLQEEETIEVMSSDKLQENEDQTRAMLKDQKLVDQPAERNTHSTKDEDPSNSNSTDDRSLQKDMKWVTWLLKAF